MTPPRSPGGRSKRERMMTALGHREADRVPVSDFFWGSFLKRWREELGLAPDADIYRYYDLDWIQFNPNLDPHIKAFEVLEEDHEHITVRTGFEAVLRKNYDQPMPGFVHFETDTIEKLECFAFDSPEDERRYLRAGDDQINGVGDGFARDTPPFVERVRAAYPDFPVFGGVCEAHEMFWRIVGTENALAWMGLYPDAVAGFVERLHAFNLGLLKAQIRAGGGMLDGMVIWGDVAYKKGLLFSPRFWREHFKPGVKAMIDCCHEHGLPVIYHGCGNVNRIFEDFVELGVDAYNPLEFKAGMDVLPLRRTFGHRIGFCGNMDVQAWSQAPLEDLRAVVLTKLNAAKGGGYIFQSDHSVPDSVSAERYEYVLNIVRAHGRYPLALGEYDLPEFG